MPRVSKGTISHQYPLVTQDRSIFYMRSINPYFDILYNANDIDDRDLDVYNDLNGGLCAKLTGGVDLRLMRT